MRNSYHHGDLRDAALRVAITLIARDGVEAFSLRAVAREVGVSPSALYRHFADKDALVAAVAADGFARLAARFAAVPGPDPLTGLGAEYVAFAVENPTVFRLMFRAGGAAAGAAAWEALVDAVGRAGVPPAARRDAALLCWSAVHGFANLRIDGALAEDRVEDGLAAVLDGITRGLARGTSAPDGW